MPVPAKPERHKTRLKVRRCLSFKLFALRLFLRQRSQNFQAQIFFELTGVTQPGIHDVQQKRQQKRDEQPGGAAEYAVLDTGGDAETPCDRRGPQLLLDRGQCRLQIGQLGFRLAAPEQTFIRIGPVNRFAHFFQGVGG